MSDVVIRAGVEGDLPALRALICELAEYERCSGEVETSVEEMRVMGFGRDKLFHFFVAEKNGAVIGIALCYFKYSTWKGRCLFLEDLIVTESERGRGYGKLLFEEVLVFARQEKVRRLEWQVLNWNEPALNFYKKYNADINDEWLNCRLTDRQIQGL